MENEEEAHMFLAEYGWQCGPESHMDNRKVHPLAAVLQRPLSPKAAAAKTVQIRPRSRQEAIRARQSTIHLTKQLDKLTGTFKGTDGGKAAGEKETADLLEKQEERIARYNALGVFKPSVSIVRACALYHVELARRLKSANLTERSSARSESARPDRKASVAAPPPAPGLHNKLDRILSDAPPVQNPSFRAGTLRRTTRRATLRRTKSKFGMASLQKEPSKLDLLLEERTTQLVENVHGLWAHALLRGFKTKRASGGVRQF